MIVITEVKCLDVEADMHEIMHVRPWDFIPLADGSSSVEAETVQKEVIKGRRFVRPDGEPMVVGVSQAAQDVIGLQYEAWESLEKDRDLWHTQCVSARLELNQFKNAGLWQRLKYLFGKS